MTQAASPILANVQSAPDQISRRTAMIGLAGAAGLAACADSAESAAETSASLAGFALNLETWWRGLTLRARIDAAARAGFTTAEMWGIGSDDRDPAALRQVSRDAGLEIVHCTVDVPNLVAASAVEAHEAVEASLAQITRLGARYGTVVGHNDIEGLSRPDMLSRYQDRMMEVAPLFEAANVIACIEPFNPFEHPDHFLYGAADAVGICRAINSPNVKLNWDLFHMQRHEGNIVHHLRDGFDQCGLIQIADSPDRRQPGTGEMNYRFILSEAVRLGYSGPIGLECFPAEGSDASAVDDIRQLASMLQNED